MSRAQKNVKKLKESIRSHYKRIYTQVATQLFKWEGLPDTIPAHFIEDRLFRKGSIMFAKTDLTGEFVTDYVNEGTIDMYDRPTKYRVVNNDRNINGISFPREEVVIIKNNINKLPTEILIEKNIDELVELHITKLMNQTWQRMPVIFQGNHTVVQSLRSLIEDMLEGGSPVAITDKSLNIDMINPIDTRTQYLGAELRDETKMVVGELLTTLGINNLEVSKKERLVAAEADINKQEVNIHLLSFLEPRKQAAEEINKLFGLNVTVDVNEALFIEEVLDDAYDNGEGFSGEV